MDNAGPRESKIRLSVILNFYDPRGHVDHLESWTSGQTLPQDEFEVIVATTAAHAANRDEIRKHLRPHDQLICRDTSNPFELYNPAVDASAGKFLFFSEDHCIAKPDCLETALKYMSSTGHSGASVKWGHINHNEISKMEELICDRDFETWFTNDHWNKLRIRGFILSREPYLEVGGFAAAYQNFSEAILSAKLKEAGFTIGYLDEGGVDHINTHEFSELLANVWTYSWNECKYCEENDPEFCERYFGETHHFLQDQAMDPDVRRSISFAQRVLFRRWMGRWGKRGDFVGLIRSMFRSWLSRLVGAQTQQGLAYLKLYLARLRYLMAGGTNAKFAAIQDYWLRGVDCARWDYLVSHPPASSDQLPLWRGGEEFGMACNRAIGVHAIEHYEGKTFFWTKPVCLLEFDLPPKDCEIVIETAGWRNLEKRAPVELLWNDQPLEQVQREGTVIRARISKSDFLSRRAQTLAIATTPQRVGHGESRSLGLPIQSIRFEPIH